MNKFCRIHQNYLVALMQWLLEPIDAFQTKLFKEVLDYFTELMDNSINKTALENILEFALLYAKLYFARL